MSEHHAPEADLASATRDMHRALASLKEKLEAIDRDQQRWEACPDPSLKAVLAHSRDAELEHASMAIEWLRRQVSAWNSELRTYGAQSGTEK